MNIGKYDLSLKEKSKLFTPIYTIPSGWDNEMGNALDNFLNSQFSRSRIPRTLYEGLDWETLDWNIFDAMKTNIREKFTVIARKVGSSVVTVKKHFCDSILPNCVVANYFFPKGYRNCKQVFLMIYSDYEFSLIEALSKLPCTTYVFPLENSIILGLFHESISDILETLQKMEEKAIIDDYLLYNPLAYSK